MVDLREGRSRARARRLGDARRRQLGHEGRRIERKGSLTVAFDRVTINGRSYPIRATVTQALESEGIMGEKEKIGAGAGVGAIIGGILGGVKGALAGILIGGGGTIAATEGKDVELPPGTVLRVRLDSPLVARSTGHQGHYKGHKGRMGVPFETVDLPDPCVSRPFTSHPSPPRRGDRLVDVLRRVRRGQEPRLELRRRRVDAAR